MINIVYEVNSYKLIVDNVVDYIVKEEVDRYTMIEMDNFDDDVDEYLNQNKIMVHEDFVVDMDDEKMKI